MRGYCGQALLMNLKASAHLKESSVSSYVSTFSYLDSTHIPLDTHRCTSHHCLYKCAGNHFHGHMDQNLQRDMDIKSPHVL